MKDLLAYRQTRKKNEQNNIVKVPFLGQQALNKCSNPTINVVVYFHTEPTATTVKTLKGLGTSLQSLPRGVYNFAGQVLHKDVPDCLTLTL